MASYTVSNINTVNIAPNEILTVHSFNRNFEKLLENDKALNQLKHDIYNNRIRQWDKTEIYNLGDIVWYRTSNGDIVSQYLLRSLKNNNTNTPEYVLKNNKEVFNDSAWEDLNEYSTLFQDNLSVFIGRYFNSYIQAQHELETDYHRYGELTSDNIDENILKKDLSNIDDEREHLFYPYETKFLDSDNTIINGFYRKWDNGILEYDIIYKLGFTGDTKTYNKLEYDVVKCNTIELSDDNYYFSDDDKDIFQTTESDDNYILFNNHIETNRNWFVNTYSSKIELPEPFMDTNYMFFGSDIRRQERNTSHPTVDAGVNTITYTNKTESSFYPIYIVYSEDGIIDARKSGIVNNNFHVKLVGRWK